MSASEQTSLGAYGLALPDLPGQRWLSVASPDWPTWSFSTRVGEPPVAESITDDVAVLCSQSGAWHEISRAEAQSVIVREPEGGSASPMAIPAAAYVHPILGLTALAHAEWRRWLSFHAGAVSVGGGVWGLLGSREAGKSSTLAWLVQHGHPVVADDLLITDGNNVYAGPRCLDLREEAARRFDLGEYLGVVGTRERWRHTLGPIDAELPLLGWIRLGWGDRPVCRRVSLNESFEALAAQRALLSAPKHPVAWLDAVSKPLFDFMRPRSWAHLTESMGVLLDTLSAQQTHQLASATVTTERTRLHPAS